ncbi:unnamed protein product [Toxocara canis]|uniref:BTB/POZ domain-containing protein At1g04390 n=1 Tax=Toxocara canis TaxID=6265 RepID=A0A183UWX7_TOXCA|nr:unnamed protein product [Toxocara canis]
MMLVLVMALARVEERWLYRHFSWGFCNLLSLLKSSKDYHEKKAAFALLWKALSVGSEAVVGWITVILSTLIDDSVVSKEEATRECLLALTQRSKVSDIVHFLLLITDDLTECVLTIIRQAPKTKINEVVAQLKFVPFERSSPCMMRLILGDELHLIEKHDVNRFVLSKGSIECVEMLICFDEVVVPRGMLELAVQCATRNRLILKTPQLFSTELLSSMKLDYAICLFEICEHLSRRSLEHSLALIRNPTFPKHPSLVSSLSTLYACISEWSRNQCMPRQLTADVLQLVKEALSSAKAAEISYQQTELSYDCSLAEYLAWISESDERLCSFLKLWLQRRANEVTVLSVNFLIGLMPKMNAENVELYLQLLTVFADSNPSLVINWCAKEIYKTFFDNVFHL